MDVTKHKLRENDEKRRYAIESYMQRDPSPLPGWLFLTPTLVALYGICPHLNVIDTPERIIEQRTAWLASRTDTGDAYREAHRQLVQDEYIDGLRLATETARLSLSKLVQTAFDENPGLPALDPLLEVITSYRQSKNRGKKVKTAWEKTLEEIARIEAAISFDMLLYYDILTGAKISKAAVAELSADRDNDSVGSRLRRAVLAVVVADKELKQHRENVQVQYSKATDKLYELICADFVVDQEGRYFKRWYHLGDAEKTERIESFCEHYLGTLVDASDRARLLVELQQFVQASLANKTLKVSEIKWSTKAGKIETILRLNFDGKAFFLDQVDEEARRLRRNKNEINNSKKKKALQDIDSARLNRVLLKNILAFPTHRKDILIDSVLWNCCHCTTPQVRESTREHLVASYGAICDAIREAPAPSFNLTTK